MYEYHHSIHFEIKCSIFSLIHYLDYHYWYHKYDDIVKVIFLTSEIFFISSGSFPLQNMTDVLCFDSNLSRPVNFSLLVKYRPIKFKRSYPVPPFKSSKRTNSYRDPKNASLFIFLIIFFSANFIPAMLPHLLFLPRTDLAVSGSQFTAPNLTIRLFLWIYDSY